MEQPLEVALKMVAIAILSLPPLSKVAAVQGLIITTMVLLDAAADYILATAVVMVAMAAMHHQAVAVAAELAAIAVTAVMAATATVSQVQMAQAAAVAAAVAVHLAEPRLVLQVAALVV